MQKAVIAVVVVFIGFWMFTDPNGLADASQTAGSALWGATEKFFSAVIDFVGAL